MEDGEKKVMTMKEFVDGMAHSRVITQQQSMGGVIME